MGPLLAADMDFGGFVWGLLLEWKKFVRPIKVGVSTQIKSMGSVGVTTGVAPRLHDASDIFG
jgi:hypothetical protein